MRSFALAHPADIVDVFVYVVVLNLAVEYVPSVIIETFTLSLVTAVLLKLVLEVVLVAKGRITHSLTSATTRRGRAVAALSLWLVAAGSKIVVLELVALVFRGSVVLGGFWSVTGLVLVLLMARSAVRWLIGEPLTSAGNSEHTR